MMHRHAVPSRTVAGALLAAVALAATPPRHRAPGAPSAPAVVSAKLSEWKVELSEATIAAGPVTFTITNAGSIPHALEVEGERIERATPLIESGGAPTPSLTPKPGGYEGNCPAGYHPHKRLRIGTHPTAVGPGVS